ncbi:1-deoxy-D-xylulose-5-phosphate reductoisomerase [Parabacteroides sp. PF5-6]|uniref:1-deoxy-D-xylulose-5-phosphate reductoisomerase n=1 Tax=Parabacteroides sp. PF5-6 TaxID=1742403 RepID=UPI0024075B9B|nr:1-deoxy-D-xylulose-5-phosphate reductoisomerase [Parabacteroides sp. PF5-6]MDF9831458.1 1-deoxy-D-xylulose-5-phosphate reductoisomerase [Parabacteroides sp. PF5-6]
MKRQLAILGSTGSIGTQALEVVSENPDLFEVYALTANNQVDLLINQARRFMPEVVVIANEQKYPELKEALEDLPIKVWAGADAIAQVVQSEPIQMVLTAMVGYSGLKPTIAAIKAGKAIALANKETLVVAGELITALAQEYKVPVLPVDSEHSAIFQCLVGAWENPVEKILLTASGGPFRTLPIDELAKVTKAQALRHPNWTMGAKITIDSASMMNKGFEMIEAKWLFGLAPEQIEVLVHPQSIIHSMVQFEDGAVMAQLGIPDMKLPIAYAFSYPKRLKSTAPRLDFLQQHSLTFEEPDTTRFRNLAFAYEAIHKGGNLPCVMNAANEVVVAAFLEDRIGFLQMSEVIEQTMAKVTFIQTPTYDNYVETDAEARRIAKTLF